MLHDYISANHDRSTRKITSPQITIDRREERSNFDNLFFKRFFDLLPIKSDTTKQYDDPTLVSRELGVGIGLLDIVCVGLTLVE